MSEQTMRKKKRRYSLYDNAKPVGFLSVFYVHSENPLNIWEKQVRNGYIKRVVDQDGAKSLQILGPTPNTFSTYIMTPPAPYATLGVRLPHLVLILRRMARVCALEVQILDNTRVRRRFRFYNFQITVRRTVSSCFLPLVLVDGWNEVSVNLEELTTKIYSTQFVECIRIKIYPNCRLRQIYFTANPLPFDRALSLMRVCVENNTGKILPTPRVSKTADPSPVPKTELIPGESLAIFMQTAPQESDNLLQESDMESEIEEPKEPENSDERIEESEKSELTNEARKLKAKFHESKVKQESEVTENEPSNDTEEKPDEPKPTTSGAAKNANEPEVK